MQSELTRRVDARLDRGERWLVLDLRMLSEIDAAGVGDLVRALNRTRAAGGVLQIANASRRVQTLLDVTCVSKLLTVSRDTAPNVYSAAEEQFAAVTRPERDCAAETLRQPPDIN